MEKIKVLSDKIEDEIRDAEEYAKLALDCKDEDPATAEVYYKLANEEIGHANMLHSRVVALIEAYKKDSGDIPEPMQMVYNILHKKHIENMATARSLLLIYKG